EVRALGDHSAEVAIARDEDLHTRGFRLLRKRDREIAEPDPAVTTVEADRERRDGCRDPHRELERERREDVGDGEKPRVLDAVMPRGRYDVAVSDSENPNASRSFASSSRKTRRSTSRYRARRSSTRCRPSGPAISRSLFSIHVMCHFSSFVTSCRTA